MIITHIATEVAKLAKVGGLADVLYGLSKELIKQKENLLIILPFYDSLNSDLLIFGKKETKTHETLGLLEYQQAYLEDIPLILIKEHHQKKFFRRESVYGELDDIQRFLFFNMAAFEYLKELKSDLVVHAHDWPATLSLALLKEFPPQNFKSCGMLTIHNMKHQGRCSKKHLEPFLNSPLSSEFFEKAQDPNNPSLLNLLKLGIEYADHITTVSPTYSKEIQTEEFGYNLDKLLVSKKDKLSGILNGIDFNYWDPKSDPHIFSNFKENPINQALEAKKDNKEKLFSLLNLKKSDAPLYACITRLDPQKAPHLIAEGIKHVLGKGGYFFLQGTPSSLEVKKLFNDLQLEYKENLNFYFYEHFDEKFAHKIYAASDFIFIPSLFEPCGLTQMIAMRYGSIPLTRKTGGLADTVFDFEDPKVEDIKKTGLNFIKPEKTAVQSLIDRSFDLYYNPIKKDTVVQNCLLQDNSWQESAQKYKVLYKLIISKA